MAEPVERIAADLLGTCPLPRSLYDRILLGHGSGGLLSAELIQRRVHAGFRQRRAFGHGGSSDRASAESRPLRCSIGSPSRPIRLSFAPSFSLEATLASWRSMAP